MANVSLRCPNCQRVDSVQKISAIVNGGISAGRYSGYANSYYDSAYINITNYNQTRLSKLLSPPKNPYNAIRHYSSESVYIKELVGIAAVGLAALGCMLVIIFFWSLFSILLFDHNDTINSAYHHQPLLLGFYEPEKITYRQRLGGIPNAGLDKYNDQMAPNVLLSPL